MEEFENHKAKLAEQFNDESLLECQSPQELYDHIASYTKPKPQKPAPHGKAPFYSPSDSGAKNYAEFVDELYKTAYYDAEATPEERAEARKQIDELFQSLIEGRSWEQFKRSKNYDTIIKTNVETCPNCGKTLIDGARCSCGYDPYSKKHRPKPYKNPLVK